MKRLLGVLLLLVFVTAPAAAQTFPPLTGRVVDQAKLLSSAQKLDIESKSDALEASTGRQFVVATVNSLEGRPIEDYAYQLGRAWGIGQKDKDDGVILLVAPNEREVWISTGYGAGAFLTDAMSGVIIRERILPEFKKNPPNYGAGITAGSDAIINQMKLPPDQAQANLNKANQQQKQRGRSVEGAGFIPVIVIIIIFFSIIGSLSRRSRGRRYRSRRGGGIDPWIVLWGLNEISRGSRGGGWGGGGGFSGGGGWGGGGGGFSGGGGSFGGGGAGGSW